MRVYPGGWRNTTKPTEAECVAARVILEKERRKLERGKPLTVDIGGVEYGRRRYVHMIAGELQGTAWNNIRADSLHDFLKGNTKVARRRIRWGLYYNVPQFTKEWRKRLTRLARTERMRQKRIDEAKNRTHVDVNESNEHE